MPRVSTTARVVRETRSAPAARTPVRARVTGGGSSGEGGGTSTGGGGTGVRSNGGGDDEWSWNGWAARPLRRRSVAPRPPSALTLARQGGPAAAEGPAGLKVSFGAPQRVAIVVSNQDCQRICDLDNARRDIPDIAKLLRGFGFAVFDGHDVARRAFETLSRTSLLNVPDQGEALFHHAGHGIRPGRRNNPLPAAETFDTIHDLPLHTMTLDRGFDALSARGTTHGAIIDACRENPFPDVMMAGDLGRAAVREQGLLQCVPHAAAYAGGIFHLARGAGAGRAGRRELALYRRDPDPCQRRAGTNILALFLSVREDVHNATGGRQVPWESSTRVRPFQFRADDTLVPAQATLAPPPDGTTRNTPPPARLPQRVDLRLPFDRTVPLGRPSTKGWAWR